MSDETTTSSWKDGIFLKITNILVSFLFVGLNVHTITESDEVYRSLRETYITPAYWTFWIWSLIHLLLLGYLIYQFTDAGKDVVVDVIGWRFPFFVILNAIYANVGARGHYVAAFIFVMLVTISVTNIYYVVKKNHNGGNLGGKIFVHLPFSLYHGWTGFLFLLTAFEAFGLNAAKHSAGVGTKILVFLALSSLEGTAVAYAFSSPEGDIAGAIAITWSLFGIYEHQNALGHGKFISISSLVFACISAFGIAAGVGVRLFKWYLAWRNLRLVAVHDEERAPLVGN